MKWETVIGLEVHAQLNTRSKIFSGASTAFGSSPNSQACAVDVALPGTLPVLNRAAVEKAIRFGLSVGGRLSGRSVFARKNYFYPDLPKGYQISQYEAPVVVGGSITILVDGAEKTVRLTRAHLEEDAGKSLHDEFPGETGIDLNRAGTPLLEIVSEPDMRSSAEAVAYAKALHGLVRWIDICDGNMQEGSFRCDANVSVRPAGSTQLGTRCEIKNLNSFRFLEQAIEFEVRRQIELLEDGGAVVQQTRLYDPQRVQTRPMRSKEDAHDYRYFPDPDLLPLEVSEPWLAEVQARLPELPEARRNRYRTQYALSAYDAAVLTVNPDIGSFFESVTRYSLKDGESPGETQAKLCANWVINEVSARMNAEQDAAREVSEGLSTWKSGMSAQTLGQLIRRVREGVINAKTARELFTELWARGRETNDALQGGNPQQVDELIDSRGLRQLSDTGALEKIAEDVIATHAQQVADYRAGKEKAFNALVGQIMKASKGKANPQQVNEILKRKLASGS